MQLYKLLNEDGTSCNGGNATWNRQGKWMPFIEKLEPCNTGYHLCRFEDVLKWVAPALWIAEFRGDMVEQDDKVVVQQARIVKRVKGWNERNLRHFACDCADRAFSRVENPDERCLNAVAVARRFADGDATEKELKTAASAVSAASAAYAANAAANAAYAAYAVASAAEKAWQHQRLRERINPHHDTE